MTKLDRRADILAAALGCFLEKSYAATSIADIRARSGASTGSIYHFFPGKAAIAEALLLEAVAGWSAAGPAPEKTPQAVLTASVSGLLEWGSSNRQLFRFLDEVQLLPPDPDLSRLRTQLADGQARAAQVYAGLVEHGAVRPLPWPVAYALLVGPAYGYLRRLALDPTLESTPEHRQLLIAAAWEAVRAPS